MNRLRMAAVGALVVLSLAIAGCQDSGTDSSIDAGASIPATSEGALPSVSASEAP